MPTIDKVLLRDLVIEALKEKVRLLQEQLTTYGPNLEPQNRAALEASITHRIQKLSATIIQMSQFEPRSFGANDAIAEGALVRLRRRIGGAAELDETWWILGAWEGLLEVDVEGQIVQVRNGQAGFGGTVLGRKVGDRFTVYGDGRGVSDEEIEILSVA